VDANGNLQTAYSYDPYGNTTVSGQSNGNQFQYTGRENDGNGLYYYRARYYSSLFERFISEDPRKATWAQKALRTSQDSGIFERAEY
jgi:RHS repeat-associated protein